MNLGWTLNVIFCVLTVCVLIRKRDGERRKRGLERQRPREKGPEKDRGRGDVTPTAVSHHHKL